MMDKAHQSRFSGFLRMNKKAPISSKLFQVYRWTPSSNSIPKHGFKYLKRHNILHLNLDLESATAYSTADILQIRKMNNLRSLNLDISEDELTSFSRIFTHLKHLKSLLIQYFSETEDSSMKPLIKFIKNLHKIRLYYLKVAPLYFSDIEEAYQFGKIISKFGYLTTLSLRMGIKDKEDSDFSGKIPRTLVPLKKLDSLELIYYDWNFVYKDIISLNEAVLTNFTQLSSLSIQIYIEEIDNSCVEHLREHIVRLTRLKRLQITLSFSPFGVNDVTLPSLLSLLAVFSDLKDLSTIYLDLGLGAMILNEEALSKIILHFHQLRQLQNLSLSLKECSILSLPEIINFSKALGQIGHLKTLNQYFQMCDSYGRAGEIVLKRRDKTSVIVKMDKDSNLGEQNLPLLKEAFAQIPNINNISLEFDQPSLAWPVILSSALDSIQQSSRLESLQICLFNLKQTLSEDLFKAITKSLQRFKQLEIFSLYCGNLFTRSIQASGIDNNGLQEIILSLISVEDFTLSLRGLNGIWDNHIKNISEALVKRKKLKRLSLSFLYCPNITAEGMLSFAIEVAKLENLKILELDVKDLKQIGASDRKKIEDITGILHKSK